MIGRIVEPVLLGITANVIINFFFNPQHSEWVLEEFVVACILWIPITELNMYIDQTLEKKIDWVNSPRRRLITHFVVISLALLIVLNILGNGYLWLSQRGFFSWSELLTINLVVLCLAVLLTLIKWGVHFYTHWVQAERQTAAAVGVAEELRKRILPPTSCIELQKGTSKLKIEPQTIHLATIVFDTVRVYWSESEWGVFAGSLSQLYAQLPGQLFFQITRDAVLHRDTIRSLSSGTFGKIELSLKQGYADSSSFTVSRPKAAAFRKWYNSNSA
jgi:LytTr DNA-binding domain